MNYCSICGGELREGAPFCPHCGQRVSPTEPGKKPVYTEAEFEVEEDEIEVPVKKPEKASYSGEQKPAESTQKANTYANTPLDESPKSSPVKETQPVAPEPKKKISGLSIAAFVCSLTIFLSGLGIILAIIDLLKGRTQPRKKGLSVAALIIGGIFLLLAFIGNNIDLQSLMAPKEETFAEIRGGTVYSADSYDVAIGDHNWILIKEHNNQLVFCPAAEKGQEGGPSTSIWVSAGNSPQKTPEQYLEFALKSEGNSISIKPKSLMVKGLYKGAWAEGKRNNRTTRMAAWTAESQMFLVSYYGVGLDSDGEAVYQDILNSFALRKPQEASATQMPSSASTDQSTEAPAQEDTKDPQSMVLRFEAPAEQVAYIDSITFDGQGNAELHLSPGGLQTDDMSFGLRYCIVREPEKGPILLASDQSDGIYSSLRQPYPMTSADRELKHFSLGWGGKFSDVAYAKVFSGQYMQFFLVQGHGLANEFYWTTNPIYIPEWAGTETLPFALSDYQVNILNKDYSEAGEYTYTSASDLNQTLEAFEAKEQKLWDCLTFRPNTSREAFQSWIGNESHYYTHVLYGPGFAEIGAEMTLYSFNFPKDGTSEFSTRIPSLLVSKQNRHWKLDNYSSGEYLLAIFYEGTFVGGCPFTLR